MLVKQMTFMGDAAGIVLGARVPIELTSSRAENTRTRLSSYAVGAIMAAGC